MTVGSASPPSRLRVIIVLGIGQVLVWGSTYYLPAVLAKPTADATGWPLSWVIGGLSLGLLLSGLVSPQVGDLIERRGGRPVLMGGALLAAIGQFGMAFAPNLPLYIGAWLVLGVAMGASLYDPAFAALGRLYGKEARTAITSLTLIAGFASTICWPLSALLLDWFGWRGACFSYGMLSLCLVVPLYGLGLPREPLREVVPHPQPAATAVTPLPANRLYALLFCLVALSLTLASVIAAVVSVHLLTVLEMRGVPLATAVALGTLIGPCQVGARLIDLAFGQRFHPVWEMLIASVLVVLGLGLLFSDASAVLVGLIVYGAGIGLRSIVRGTLPLAVFGPVGYAGLMGRLAFPMLVAQAAAPSIGAVVLARFGASALMALLFWIAVATLVSGALLVPFVGPRPVGR